MLGYVTAFIPELKVRELEIYNGYYCGVCKSIGRRYGQIPRLVLSYDSAFIAMLISGLSDDSEVITQEHCIVHHIKKKTIVSGISALDYSADMMIILAYLNFIDDINDEDKFVGHVGKFALQNVYDKIFPAHRETVKKMEEALNELYSMEKENSGNIDRLGMAFGNVMKIIFTDACRSQGINDAGTVRMMSSLGSHLGRWIYLLDAYDDLEKDIKRNEFNPLIYRFNYNGEDIEEFKNRIKEDVEFNLTHYLSFVNEAYDLLDIKKNKGVLDNILYLGLKNKTTEIIKGKGEMKHE